MNKKLSVVVPVYNNEKYLPKCIQSIIDQTYTNLEIFLVDDGSPDNCGAICDEFAKKDSRITVIHKKNEGVVIARNCGIEKASGKYIAFVDSDDWIEPNMYEEMLQQGKDCDVITSDCYINFDEQTNARIRKERLPKGVYTKDKNLNIVFENLFYSQNPLEDMGIVFPMAFKIFKTSIAKKVAKRIPTKQKYAEDGLFTYTFLTECSSVCVTHGVFYHYRMNDNSATHSNYEHFLTELETIYLHMKSIFATHPLKEILMAKLERYINYQLLYSTNRMMGFSLENQIVSNRLPFEKEDLQDLNIVLYGASIVGQHYYQQLTRLNTYKSLLWVDKNATNYKQKYGYNVEQVSALQNVCYDAIIIAVKKEQTALSIKNELIANGVDESKIHWRTPIELFDIIYPRNASQNDINTQNTNFAPLNNVSINRNGGAIDI